jgi:nucleoside-diphosphate-sugar epimerase
MDKPIKHMRILITGGIGYVGTELCKNLSYNLGYDITVVDSRFNTERVTWLIKHGFKFFQRDIFDIKDLLENCDICFHLAGITDVPQVLSQSTPEKDAQITKIGTDGTRYIINNAAKSCKIIFASTQVVYEGLTEEKFNIKEDFEPCPVLAYSKSKRQSEIDLFDSDRNFIIARFASVYGYNESTRWKILPNLFSKMTSQNQDLNVFGEQNYKPLIGVNDLVRCLDFLAHSSYNREIFHCVNENLRIIDIANICKKINDKIKIIITKDEAPNKGFTLSGQKLLNTGFQFNQNIETEMNKMVAAWKNK